MMKKLSVALLFLPIVIMASKCEKTPPATTLPKPQTITTNQDSINISLNGFKMEKLLKMRIAFKDSTFNSVSPQKKVSIWFSRAVFTEMLNVLRKERENKTDGAIGTPDGMRFYFINDGKATKRDFEIAVVSTKLIEEEPGYSIHQDYYKHSAKEALFNLNNIKGEKGIGDCGGGARLYKHCQSCQDIVCPHGPQNGRLRINDAEAMVGNFGTVLLGKKINTKSVWFDYHKLDSISKLKFDGIRVYYGRYTDNNTSNEHIVQELKQRDTFILMPTIAKTTNQVTIQEDNLECETRESWLFNVNGKKDDPYNNGEICPTHCNLDTLGFIGAKAVKKK